MAWVALLLFSKSPKVVKWFLMQYIKQGSTLRISPKREKPSLKIVRRYGKQEEQIEGFLIFRRQIGDMWKRIETESEKQMLNVQ